LSVAAFPFLPFFCALTVDVTHEVTTGADLLEYLFGVTAGFESVNDVG
jgi:hypothetical protein